MESKEAYEKEEDRLRDKQEQPSMNTFMRKKRVYHMYTECKCKGV